MRLEIITTRIAGRTTKTTEPCERVRWTMRDGPNGLFTRAGGERTVERVVLSLDPVKDCHSVLTLPSISVSSPLPAFSRATARRSAARAISLLAQRRSDRDEVERFLADHDAQQHSAVD